MVDRFRLVAFGRFVTDWERENDPVDGNPGEEEFHCSQASIWISGEWSSVRPTTADTRT
ncbi:hypothetical protein ABT061_16180 [Streptosporangium sp. NPDC002544]|uniref:hypothetical protein n=1 Tax=Streptosporangium sp. NPDC002544 TaxID=3154538 RepID=UPI0033241806